MKRKIIAFALIACLAITAIAGASLAYLQDADKDINVMTLGNVKIVQNEEQRPLDEKGLPIKSDKLEAFEQDKPIYPAVPTSEKGLYKDGTITDTDGSTELAIWDASINNEIDKFVSVTNRGTEDAYIRTILLFETVRSYAPNSSDTWTDLHDEFFLINGSFTYLAPAEDLNKNEAEAEFTYVTLTDEEGVSKEYAIAVKTYEDPVAADETTTASLRQFALSWDAGNEVYDFFGPEYDIIALSQAVQVAGFDTIGGAEVALNTAFGEVNAENIIKWLGETTVKTSGGNNVIGGELDSETNGSGDAQN